MAAKRVIAVFAERASPALAALPALVGGHSLHVCHDSKDLLAISPSPNALLWIPPASPSELLKAWPQLAPSVSWFHSFSAGVDSLAHFFEESRVGAPDSKVLVTNGRGAFSESLAEYTLWAMLHHTKQTERCIANKASKTWDKFVMPQLRGKTVGFLGFGHLASTTAPLCRALGMRILALRSSGPHSELADETLWMDELDGPRNKARVFAESDFVVCTLPGTKLTRHFCDSAAFGLMKRDAVFISLGRGSAVDEAALARALSAGSIAGAACDVFEHEPLAATSPLWECPRLLVTAHNADYELRYFEHGWRVWQGNLAQFVAGEPLLTPIVPSRGY